MSSDVKFLPYSDLLILLFSWIFQLWIAKISENNIFFQDSYFSNPPNLQDQKHLVKIAHDIFSELIKMISKMNQDNDWNEK